MISLFVIASTLALATVLAAVGDAPGADRNLILALFFVKIAGGLAALAAISAWLRRDRLTRRQRRPSLAVVAYAAVPLLAFVAVAAG